MISINTYQEIKKNKTVRGYAQKPKAQTELKEPELWNNSYTLISEIVRRKIKIQRPGLWSIAFLLGAGIMMLPYYSFSQDKKTVPDGTEGDVLVIKDSVDKLPKKKWNTIDLGFTTVTLGVGMLFDYGGFSQDKNGKIQTDSINAELKSSFQVRDFRFLVSGKLNTKRIITWKAGVMHDAAQNAWFLRESGIMVNVPELWGNIFVGRTKEGYSASKIQNGYAGEAIERYAALDQIPILADGIKWMAYLPKKRILWNVGMFTDWVSKNEGFATYKWQFVARLGWLPIYDATEKTNLHIGASFRVGRPDNDNMRLRSKPEANNAPFFIQTEEFPTSKSSSVGGEIYYVKGRWMFGSEYNWHMFNSPTKDNPVFNGGEVVVVYMFNGEHKPYYPATGIYGFTPVKKSIFQGGPGVWEGMLRFARFDLNDGPVKGGSLWRLTPQISWYPSNNFRFTFAYGYAILNRYELKGTTQIFQARLRFSIL